MCNIVSEYWTVTQPIEVYKLCRKENDGKELRSQFEPNLRTKRFEHLGEDVLYRHVNDIGKRILVAKERPGFCVFESIAGAQDWGFANRKLLKVTIPMGANICRIAIQGIFTSIRGYATNMLEINCNDPWPGENK